MSCKRPCEQCPWRTENHGKRTPWGFYRKRNLRRLWNQIRRGGRPQGCHPTDPSHPDHVAAGAKPDSKPQECIGSVILVLRELEAVQKIGGGTITPDAIETYLEDNPRGLTRSGLSYWILNRYQLGGTPLGGPTLPKVDLAEPNIARYE